MLKLQFKLPTDVKQITTYDVNKNSILSSLNSLLPANEHTPSSARLKFGNDDKI